MAKNKKAIVVLGGGLTRAKNGKWRTTNYGEGDNFAVMGDRLRVVAAGYIYEEDSDCLLVVLGGKGQYKNVPDAPAIADVVANELIELGVPAGKIILENVSANTYEQLQFLKKIIKTNSFKSLLLISNDWHLPRVRAFIEADQELNMIGIELLSAEDVLLNKNSDVWKKAIEDARQSESMKARIKLEQIGVRQIKNGTYKY